MNAAATSTQPDDSTNGSPMGASTRTALLILSSAAALGIAGDALLRVDPWGINAPIWMALLSGAWLFVQHGTLPERARRNVPLAALAVAATCGLAWRDAPQLALLNLATAAAVLALPFLRVIGARLGRASLSQLGGAGVIGGLHAGFGSVLLLVSDIGWPEVRRERSWARSLAVVRGLAIAVPLLVVFAALFASADAVFARFVTEVLKIDLKTLVTHLMLAAFCAWVSAGALRGMVLQKPLSPIRLDPARVPRLGAVEAGLVFALLDLLFLSFVVIQIRYLFGGAHYLQSIPGMTYAQYARQGFFELVAVAALAIPLLLLAHWLLRPDDANAARAYRPLAGFMGLLLGVILASALTRMLLYTGEYGLTRLRFYTLAFMAFLALVLIAFVLTVLRGRRERFATAALGAWIAVAAGTGVADPDALIAKVNLARAAAGGRFDARYTASLSADATPALAAGFAGLRPDDQATVVAGLARVRRHVENTDWRTWNLARARAREALAEGPPALH